MKISTYSKQFIDKDDITSVIKTLKSDYLTSGPKVLEFEKKISSLVKSKYAVSANSATSALHLGCLALNINKNDIVWTSANSFVASANCAIYCGAKIDLVDIDLNTFNISIENLKSKLKLAKQKNTLPKVLIVVHLGGLSCDMFEIHKLSKKYKFKIIEDASHALGSQYKNRPVGSCDYSEMCIFSFHPVKIITTCEGGVVTTNSKKIEEKIKMLREHGIQRKKNSFSKKNMPFFYDQKLLGYNYRLSELHAAVGISQLKKIFKFIKKRNQIRQYYIKELKNYPVKFQEISKINYSSIHLTIIFVNSKIRNNLIKFLLNKNIKTNIHYIPIFYHSFHRKKKFFSCKQSIKYYNSSISIPCYYELSFLEVKKICSYIKKFFKNNKLK